MTATSLEATAAATQAMRRVHAICIACRKATRREICSTRDATRLHTAGGGGSAAGAHAAARVAPRRWRSSRASGAMPDRRETGEPPSERSNFCRQDHLASLALYFSQEVCRYFDHEIITDFHRTSVQRVKGQTKKETPAKTRSHAPPRARAPFARVGGNEANAVRAEAREVGRFRTNSSEQMAIHATFSLRNRLHDHSQ